MLPRNLENTLKSVPNEKLTDTGELKAAKDEVKLVVIGFSISECLIIKKKCILKNVQKI